MPTLSEKRIATLLEPYLSSTVTIPDVFGLETRLQVRDASVLYELLSTYLDLLLRWNARTNLTAIRDPEEIVQRHFGESLFAGRCLCTLLPAGASLLDFGSGAGFPGLPIQGLLPEVSVTLAECQSKKVAFLREAVRTLVCGGEVWSKRVEDLPPDLRYTCVTMRAVDKHDAARSVAWERVADNGWLMELLAGENDGEGEVVPMPGLHRGYVRFFRK